MSGPWWHAYGRAVEGGGVTFLTVRGPTHEMHRETKGTGLGRYLCSFDHDPTDAERAVVREWVKLRVGR